MVMVRRLISFSIFTVIVISISACSLFSEKIERDPIPPGFKIAFIGDQGTGSNAIAVLELIRDEGADMVLHQGDFDYEYDPDIWMKQVDDTLGRTFPYFASVGNHDVAVWKGYQSKLLSRLNKIEGAICTGNFGVNSACTYKGIFFVLSGIGTLGLNHIPYLRTELANSNADWKICSWHKNQRLMQVGGKDDEVGWNAYEECRLAGAIVATGHEHSYSRTHLMSNFESQAIASTSNHLLLSKGKSFAFVSGLGGSSIRPQVDGLGSNPWWASVYTADKNAKFGALFCSFNLNSNEKYAECYFKDIDDNIVDSFNLTSQLNHSHNSTLGINMDTGRIDLYLYIALIYLFPPFRFIFSVLRLKKTSRVNKKTRYTIGLAIHCLHFFGAATLLMYIYNVSSINGAEGVGWAFIFAIPVQIILIVLAEILMSFD